MNTDFNKNTYKVMEQEVLFDFQLSAMLDVTVAQLRKVFNQQKEYSFSEESFVEVGPLSWKDLRKQHPELPPFGRKKVQLAFNVFGILRMCQYMSPYSSKASEIMAMVIRHYIKMRMYRPVFPYIEKDMKQRERYSSAFETGLPQIIEKLSH